MGKSDRRGSISEWWLDDEEFANVFGLEVLERAVGIIIFGMSVLYERQTLYLDGFKGDSSKLGVDNGGSDIYSIGSFKVKNG